MVATDITSAGRMTGGVEVITAADGTPLKQALARANARARRRAFFLVLPLLAFVLVTFAIPIGQLLYRSIYNAAFSDNMPQLAAWFDANPQSAGVADESGFDALVLDLVAARANKTVGRVGIRVNYELPGSTSLFKSSARKAVRFEGPPYKEKMLEVDAKWDNPALWSVMRRASNPYTITFYLAALDLAFSPAGDIENVDEKRRIYVPLFLRTLILSAVIGFLCLLLGYPIAHLLATLPLRYSNLLMIFVLLPFWTSLLVRTTSWIVLFGDPWHCRRRWPYPDDVQSDRHHRGDDPYSAAVYGSAAVFGDENHSATIPPTYVRAARSLGANPFTAFWRIYFPLTVPGIGAGSLLVFILAIGYYITPALVGGATGQLISNLIAFHMQNSLNWSLAAALAALLLAGVILLYWLYDRIVGVDKMKLG